MAAVTQTGQLSVAVIGVGRIGRLHAGNLATRLPQARLVALADVNRPALETCAAELGVTALSDDYRAIVTRDDVDALIICSSTDTHSAIIQQAAAAGKHIFCEKPVDHDLARIDQALAAVSRSGVKFQVGFNCRFDHSFRRAQQAVAAGTIGQPHLLRITSRDPQPPPLDYLRVSGGIFLDMTIHDFDIARYLVGAEVEQVFAAGAVMVDPGTLGPRSRPSRLPPAPRRASRHRLHRLP